MIDGEVEMVELELESRRILGPVARSQGEEGKEKEEPERGTWTHPCDFFISCLGYAVGLGRHLYVILEILIFKWLQETSGDSPTCVLNMVAAHFYFPTF